MDKAILLLEMSVGDLALIYQLARNEKKGVNEWVMNCVMERVERIQEEWRRQQEERRMAERIGLRTNPENPETQGGGAGKRRGGE